MPKYKVKTDKGTFAVELDKEPSSTDELNSLVTAHLSGQSQASPKSREQLQHEHKLNVEAGAQDARLKSPEWFPDALKFDEPLGVASQAIGEVVRGVSMFGGPLGAMAGEAGAQEIEMAGGGREGYNPLAIGAQAAIPGVVTLAGKAARPTAKWLYGGALKLSSKIKPDKAERILETVLNEGRIPTTGSIKKSVGRQREIQKEIEDRLAQVSDRTLNAESVASRVEDIRPRFQSATPDADNAILDSAKEQFIRKYGLKEGPKISHTDEFGQTSKITGPRVQRDIPLLEGQAVKKNTYKKLGVAAYGELKGAEKESLKGLARGLKEDIETKVKDVFPELKALNANDSALFDLNRALVQAAHRIGSRDVMGIGIPIKVEAFGKAGLIAGILDSPRIKSMLALAIDKARHLQKASPTATAAITRGATLPSAWEE